MGSLPAARDLLDDDGGEEADAAGQLAQPPAVVDAVGAALQDADGVALLEGDLVPARGVVVVGGAAKVLAVVDRLTQADGEAPALRLWGAIQ